MAKLSLKFMENRKLKLLLTGIALLLVTVGSSYAWWTASTQTSQKVSMGNLKIEANMKTLSESASSGYEPGTYATITGNIKNTGTIPALVRLENDSQIQFAYANDEMVEIPLAERRYEKVDPQAIQMTIEPTSGLYEDNDKVYWYSHEDGHRYLLLDPKANLKVTMEVAFDGPNTTNKYMDAEISAKALLKATQVLEGAATAEFGINITELNDLMDAESTQKMARSSRSLSRGQAKIQELIQRGK